MAIETREEREQRHQLDHACKQMGEVFRLFEQDIMDLPYVHTAGYDHECIRIEVYRQNDFLNEELERFRGVLERWCRERRRPTVLVVVKQTRNEHRDARWLADEEAKKQ